MDIASLGIQVRTDGADKAERELNQLEKQAKETSRAANTLGKIWGTAIGALSVTAITQVTRGLVQQADQWSKLRAQLALSLNDTRGMAAAQAKLFDISQRTGTDLSATVELYSKLSQASGALASNQSELLRTTELVSKALTISGADAASTAAVIRQFSQALAAGALRGDEFVSVMEGAPRVAKAIADGLNVPIGKLRELASEGKLTADRVTEALLRSGESIDKEFARMPATVGRAMQQVENSILQLIGKTDEAAGSSRALAGAISDVADVLNDPKTVQAFQDTASGMAKITAETLKATASLAGYVRQYKEWLSDRGFLPTDENSSREQLVARRDRIQGVLGRVEEGRTFFGQDTARGLRSQLNTIDVQLNGNQQAQRYLNLPNYLQESPFSVVPAMARANATSGAVSPASASPDPGKPKARAAAVRELSAAEKAYQDVLETNALIDEQAAEASRNLFYDRQRASDQAAEDARQRATYNQSFLADLQFEFNLMRMSATEREKAIALRQLEAGATDEQRRAAAGLAEEIERTREQTMAMDTLRGTLSDTFADYITGAKSAKEATRDFFSSLLEQAARALTDQAVQALFGSFGTASGGATGGGWAAVIGALFGGGRAVGGPVSGNKLYEVGENGRPELFQQGGRTYLIPGNDGVVRAAIPGGASQRGAAAAPTIVTTVNVDNSGRSTSETTGGDENTGRQLARMIEGSVNEVLIKQMRPGGLLYSGRGR